MITFKINLMQYKAVIQKIKSKSGEMKECIVIPIEMNHLVKGEKGVYADFTAFDLKNPKADSKDTHLVKASLPKDVFQSMTEEEKKAMPIFGNLRVWGERQESEPTSSVKTIEETDDLPF